MGQAYRYREVNTQDIVDMDSTAFYTFGSRFALMSANRWYFAKYDRKTSQQLWQAEMDQLIFEDRAEFISTHVSSTENSTSFFRHTTAKRIKSPCSSKF